MSPRRHASCGTRRRSWSCTSVVGRFECKEQESRTRKKVTGAGKAAQPEGQETERGAASKNDICRVAPQCGCDRLYQTQDVERKRKAAKGKCTYVDRGVYEGD